MCYAWQLDIKSTAGAPPLSIVAKRVELPAVCSSIGDQRKKDSYDVEASFYSRGHAERLIAAGAVVPFPPVLTRTSQSLRTVRAGYAYQPRACRTYHVPWHHRFPLHVEHRPGEGVTICMTRVDGRSSHKGDSEAF